MPAISSSDWEPYSLTSIRVDQSDFLLIGRYIFVSLVEKLDRLIFLEPSMLLCHVEDLVVFKHSD